VSQELVDLGAARDSGMLYFDARLSEGNPTVEVRAPDVCTDPEDAVLVAALVRGLVTTLAPEDVEPVAGTWRVETLRAAQWRASRYAVSDRLVHPVARDLAPARDVVEALVEAVRPALDDAGDTDLVEAGVDRVLHGGGAARQRAAYERGGTVDAVVDDLIARTEATWA
jgi:carboxylate-amine ligase